MRHLILGLLLTRPLTLYDLQRAFATGLSHIYATSSGSIHRCLRRLLDDGDVDVDVDVEVNTAPATRSRKLYTANAQGHRTWETWMHTPQPGEDVEATMLARVFLLDIVPDPAQRSAVLHALRRRALAEQDELRTAAVTVDPTTPRYPRAALEYGLRSAAGAVDWLTELIDTESMRAVDTP